MNRETVVSDPKLLASAKVGRNLRIVDDVLAGQARDVGAGPANVFAVDYGDAVAFSSKRPRRDSGTGAAAENHEIELFRLRHLN